MALKGTLLETLKEARPTRFFGVPRIWEKFMEGMVNQSRNTGGLKKQIARSCRLAGLDFHLNGKTSLMYKMGDTLVYGKVKAAFGLDRCASFASGAAPLSEEVIKYFLSWDIRIQEAYGLSESTGPTAMALLYASRLGSCGITMPGRRSQLTDTNEDGEGELCLWGRHIMMGYLGKEDKTEEVIDKEGFFKTGDIAKIDKRGFVFITGRKKEILITAGGENIAPVPIEDAVKADIPAVSNAVLIGDHRKYLTMILTLRSVVDVDTDLPTNRLAPITIEWCRSQGSQAETIEEIVRGTDEQVMAAIQRGIDRVNMKAVSNAARIQKWTLLTRDLSVPGGELGPTMKLKRSAFAEKYADVIDKLYAA